MKKLKTRELMLTGFIISALVAPFFGTAVSAADASTAAANSSESTAVDSGIVLKATKIQQEYVEINRLKETKQIIVLDKKDLQEKGYTSVSQALSDVPSIMVGATGSGDIDIRGQGSDQANRNIQVLIDGAPVTTLVNHPLQSNYDIVPIEQIEKIEIVPGGGSVLYGSGAVGGVINITTNLRDSKSQKSTIATEWNSKGYRLNAAVVAPLGDKAQMEVDYSKIDRDLYFVNTYRNSDYYAVGIHAQPTEKQYFTIRASRLKEEGQHIENVNAKTLAAAGPNYVPDYQTETIGLDAEGHKITEKRRRYLYGDRELNTYSAHYRNDFADKWYFDTELFYNEGYYKNINTSDKQMDHSTRGTRMKFGYDYGNEDNLLIGIDYMQQKANLDYNDYKLVSSKNKTYKLQPYSFNYDKKTKALYVLNTIKNGRFTMTQGVRREVIDWGFDKTGNNISGADTSVRNNVAAELSMAYHYSDLGRVYARWERGYTTPDGIQISDEMKIDGVKRYVPTAADDEIFNIYEVGVRDKIGASAVSLTAFYNETNNQLNRFYILDKNGLSYQTLNLLKTKRHGIELSLSQRVGKWKFQEGLTYLKGKSDYTEWGRDYMLANGKRIVNYTKSGLKKVPKYKALLRADYSPNEQWTVGLKYTFFGKYNNFLEDANKETDGIMASYGLFDVNVTFKASDSVTWYGGISNVFNKRYYEYGGDGFYTYVPGAERLYFAGAKYTF